MVDDPDSIEREAPPPEPSIWLIDGFNVLHSGLLGGRDRANWWTEVRRQELLDRVQEFDDSSAEIWIVFDGPQPKDPDPDKPGPHCVFAPSADDWLLARLRSAPDPSEIAVVTADRQVRGRARGKGAHVVSPREFLARC